MLNNKGENVKKFAVEVLKSLNYPMLVIVVIASGSMVVSLQNMLSL